MARVKRYAPLAVVLLAAVLAWIYGSDYLTVAALAENRALLRGFVDGHVVWALLIFMGVYMVVVATSLPGGALLTITGGFLFGAALGGVATVVAATLGATGLFLAARTALGEGLSKRAGPWLEKLRKGFQEDALSYLLFLRLVPAFPFWLVNLAPAFLGVSLRVYVFGTFFGIMPGTLAFSFVGRGLDSILEKQQEAYEACVSSGVGECALSFSVGDLVTPQLLGAFAALGVVALIPVGVKRWRARKKG